MSQSVKIFAVVLVLFFVFITTKGQLPAYIGVFTGNKSTTTS